MKTILDRSNWKLFFLLLTIIGYLPYVSVYFDKITEIVLVLLFFLSVFDIIKKREILLKDRKSLLLLVAPAFYLITIVLNGFYFNDFKMFVYIEILTYFLCLDQSFDSNPLKEFERIAKVMAIFCFFMVLLSLIVYYQRVTIPFSTDIFTEKYIGIYNNSMYGILGNANILCFFSFIGLFSSIYLYKKNKLFNGINIFLQILCIILTNSRGGFLGLIVCMTVFIFLYLFIIRKKKIIHTFLIIITTFALLLCMRYTIHSINLALFNKIDTIKMEQTQINNSSINVDQKINQVVQQPVEQPIEDKTELVSNENIQKENKKETESDETIRSDEEKRDNANRRLDMYKAGLKCFSDYPLFGVGREKTASILCETYLDKNSPMNNIGAAYNMHNTYLQTLTGSGIIGFISVFGFILIMAIKSLQCVFKKSYSKNELLFLITIISYCSYALFANLFESELYLSRSITAVFFWMCLGHLYNFFFRKEHE